MLLMTIIGLSDEMDAIHRLELTEMIISKIDEVLGERKIDKENVKKYVPRALTQPSWNGKAVFISISGFNTRWTKQSLPKDFEDLELLITKTVATSAKIYLEQFNNEVRVQCSVLKESEPFVI